MKYSDPIFDKVRKDDCWFSISNCLTFLRIVLTPVIVISIIYKYWLIAFCLFSAAAVTDLMDGYLARLFDEQTNLGAFLDPIADKFFLISVFSSLAFLDSPFFDIPAWFIVLILMREFTILIGTYIVLRSNVDVKINPTIWGKLTTFFQILFISWIFICYFFMWAPSKTYYTLLTFITFFSSASLIQYVYLGIKYWRHKA